MIMIAFPCKGELHAVSLAALISKKRYPPHYLEKRT